MTALLRTRDLSLRFGGVVALDEVDLEVRPREIVGLLGPNGAGKTTLFNVISGLLAPAHGRVLFEEQEISHLLPYERVAAGIGRTFQHVRLFGSLTVYENLLVAQHRHLSGGAFSAMLRLPAHRRDERTARDRADRMLEVIDLAPWRDRYPRELSYGTLRFLQLATVLSLRPKVLLLDEPASGIAQREVEQLGSVLRRVRDDLGCALLVIEHDMGLLLDVSERLYAMDLGRIVTHGAPDDVIANDAVLESYLGRTRRSAGAAR